MQREKIRRKRRKGKNYMLMMAAALVLLTALLTFCAQAAEGNGEKDVPKLPDVSQLPRSEKPAEKKPEPTEAPGKVMLDVPYIDQTENWPTGCESVCAVMALQYAGVEVTVDEFIDGYLPMGTAPYEDGDGNLVGCDPRTAFPGDPRTEDGWGCYAPVILHAAEQLLREREVPSLSMQDLSGRDIDALCADYVNKGVPVLVWVTIDMEEPYVSNWFFLEDTWEEFQWIYPMHCAVLTGYDETGYYFNDPLKGKAVFYPKEAVQKAYAALDKQALALVRQ